MKKTVAFYTLGCRVNQYETAAMQEIFQNAGFFIVPFDTVADIYIVNTCAVTAESERKCRQILRRAKALNPYAVVAAVGCMAQSAAAQLKKMPEVDVILGTGQKHDILHAVQSVTQKVYAVDTPLRITEFEETPVHRFANRDRAFVKIQDGCDRFCSYCIIPYVRGGVRSRKEDNILREIQGLAENGFCEVVLTGIQVAAYGQDTNTTLSTLIHEVAKIDGIRHIRLSSIEPTAFTPTLMHTFQTEEKLCPHFHISLQSGCDTVLKRMNRRYTTAEYADVIMRLRNVRPDVSVTTDIITGFPGESDAEFEKTLQFVQDVRLCGIHVFPYSERPKTAAASMEPQILKAVRESRARQLIAVASTLRNTYVRGFVGSVQPVLFEHKANELSGFTPHFVRVIAQEHAAIKTDLIGKIFPVKISACEGETLYGKL